MFVAQFYKYLYFRNYYIIIFRYRGRGRYVDYIDFSVNPFYVYSLLVGDFNLSGEWRILIFLENGEF